MPPADEKDRIRELVQQWSSPFPGDEELTEAMRAAATRVAAGFLSPEEEYEIEKFTKTFCEPLLGLHTLLLQQKELRPGQLRRREKRSREAWQIKSDLAATSRRVHAEIERQERHWRTFLMKPQAL